jgi:hypothetical protein
MDQRVGGSQIDPNVERKEPQQPIKRIVHAWRFSSVTLDPVAKPIDLLSACLPSPLSELSTLRQTPPCKNDMSV